MIPKPWATAGFPTWHERPHPRRGILILEVKDFRLSTLIQADRQTWTIHGDPGPKTIANPLEQARQYAHQVVNSLERDPQLVQAEGPHKGKLVFPWSYGVVLPNITRAQFEQAELGQAIEPHRVVCQDEKEEARLFYVGATRASHRLILGVGGAGQFGTRLALAA